MSEAGEATGAREPARGFEYAADLGETTLPEMLYTIDRFQVPGTIEAEHDGVTKKVFLKEGQVVHASSTDRHDSLGAYLQRTGRLTAEQFARSMEERSESASKLYGQILIESGLLAPSEIYTAIREQIESIVWSLFYWETGQVRFRIGGFQEKADFRIQLPMRQVILQGIKRAPNAKSLIARLGQRDTVFEPRYRTEQLIAVALDAEEYALLSLVDGRRSLYEICTEGPLNPAENGKLMYAFHVMRLVQRRDAAAGSEPSSSAATGAPPEPTAGPGEPMPRKVIKIRLQTAGDKFSDDPDS